MIESEVKIGTQLGRLLREGPPPIYVLPDGMFACKHGDIWKKSKTLAGLEKALGSIEDRPAVAIFRPHDVDDGGPPEAIDAVSIDERWIIDRKGKKHSRGYSSWCVYDAKAAAKLEALAKEEAEVLSRIEKQRAAIIDKLTCVDRDNFTEIAAEHGRKGGAK